MKNKTDVLGDADVRLPSEEPSGSAEDDVVNRMTYDSLIGEFDKLPDTTRKVLRLFYVNNMTVEQISDALRVPTGTIKSMLFRTRAKLKKHLNI